jgi:hypothetical protein
MKVGDIVWHRLWFESKWERREIVGESSRSWKIKAKWSERMRDDVINLPKNTVKWDNDWAIDEESARLKELAVRRRNWCLESLEMHRRFDFWIFFRQADNDPAMFEKFLKIANVMEWELPPMPQLADISIGQNKVDGNE